MGAVHRATLKAERLWALRLMFANKMRAALSAEAGVEYASRRGDCEAVSRHRADIDRLMADCLAIERDMRTLRCERMRAAW